MFPACPLNPPNGARRIYLANGGSLIVEDAAAVMPSASRRLPLRIGTFGLRMIDSAGGFWSRLQTV